MNDDKLVIGGREFNSRFILGSGKYSMKLIEAAIKDAGAEIITLAVRRANTKEQENILYFIPDEPCFPTQAAQETPMKRFALQESQENSAAVILLKSKLCVIQNICSPIIRKRLRQPKFLQKKVLLFCLICIPI